LFTADRIEKIRAAVLLEDTRIAQLPDGAFHIASLGGAIGSVAHSYDASGRNSSTASDAFQFRQSPDSSSVDIIIRPAHRRWR
jgi:hypothetical protein